MVAGSCVLAGGDFSPLPDAEAGAVFGSGATSTTLVTATGLVSGVVPVTSRAVMGGGGRGETMIAASDDCVGATATTGACCAAPPVGDKIPTCAGSGCVCMGDMRGDGPTELLSGVLGGNDTLHHHNRGNVYNAIYSYSTIKPSYLDVDGVRGVEDGLRNRPLLTRLMDGTAAVKAALLATTRAALRSSILCCNTAGNGCCNAIHRRADIHISPSSVSHAAQTYTHSHIYRYTSYIQA
jgi:hypothetical protein